MSNFTEEELNGRFPCREVDENHVEVTTPAGKFLLAARRARKGGHVSSVVVAGFGTAAGRIAAEDQESLPVALHGRLNPPSHWSGWTFQPSCFEYEDGSHSDFLGAYPRKVEFTEEASK